MRRTYSKKFTVVLLLLSLLMIFYFSEFFGSLLKNYSMENKVEKLKSSKVIIKLYYECHCPYSRRFVVDDLKPTVTKLGNHLDIRLYPYGNAITTERNGFYEFDCLHGQAECYGNKLHACAINYLSDMHQALFFNICMMESSKTNRGSDDATTDECGPSMQIYTEKIKECAKGPKGTLLLKYYGDQTSDRGVNFVPYVLINGRLSNRINFMKEVCAAFLYPPPECYE